jgi:hypothetical protein
MASTGKWDGVYAEMAAFDFLNSDQDWLSTPINLSKTVPAAETLAGGLGGQNANFDGYYDDFGVSFDVKVLGDKSRGILDGIVAQVTAKLGITGLAVSPEYPLDLGYEQFETNRNQLRAELEKSINVGERTSFIQSSVVPDLAYRIKWDAGVLTTVSTYDPYQHAANHRQRLHQRRRGRAAA